MGNSWLTAESVLHGDKGSVMEGGEGSRAVCVCSRSRTCGLDGSKRVSFVMFIHHKK